MVLEDQAVGVADIRLPVQVDAERLAGRGAVAADAFRREANPPDRHELPERVRLRLRGLDVHEPARVVRVPFGVAGAVVDAGELRTWDLFSVPGDVEEL